MYTNKTIKEAANELYTYQLIADDAAWTYAQLHQAIAEKN